MKRLITMVLLLISMCIGAPSYGASTGPVRAGGSTLVYPIMQKWIAAYRQLKGVEVGYASTGSGKGITGMMEQTLDFGCTDAPLSDAELQSASKIGGAVIHIPLVMGA